GSNIPERERGEGIGLSLGYDQREEGNQAAGDKVCNARILEHCSWEGTADCVNAIQASSTLDR
ncbi:516_t:CDS:1, partial [Acaulospora colombiana]